MTLPAPGYGIPPPAPARRSRVPIVVLSVITGVFAALAVAGFVGFGIAISDSSPVRFATPGTVGIDLSPGSYVICQPADRALGPRTVQLDSTMVEVRSPDTSVPLTDLSGLDYCDSFDADSDDDLYEVLEFQIRDAGSYTVTVSDEYGTVSSFASVGRRISDSVFVWLGLGVLAALVAGVCFLALIVVLIVRATRKPKPTWPAPGPGPGSGSGPGWGAGSGGGYGAPAWGQPTAGQPMWPPPGSPQPPGSPPPHPPPGGPGPHPDGPAAPWTPSDPPQPPGPPPPYRDPGSG
jgi:hypothetical protein